MHNPNELGSFNHPERAFTGKDKIELAVGEEFMVSFDNSQHLYFIGKPRTDYRFKNHWPEKPDFYQPDCYAKACLNNSYDLEDGWFNQGAWERWVHHNRSILEEDKADFELPLTTDTVVFHFTAKEEGVQILTIDCQRSIRYYTSDREFGTAAKFNVTVIVK